MLASALALSACSNNTENAPAEETPAQSEVSTEVEEASTPEADTSNEASSEDASAEEQIEEPVVSTDAETAEGNVILHRGYPTEENGKLYITYSSCNKWRQDCSCINQRIPI